MPARGSASRESAYTCGSRSTSLRTARRIGTHLTAVPSPSPSTRAPEALQVDVPSGCADSLLAGAAPSAHHAECTARRALLAKVCASRDTFAHWLGRLTLPARFLQSFQTEVGVHAALAALAGLTYLTVRNEQQPLGLVDLGALRGLDGLRKLCLELTRCDLAGARLAPLSGLTGLTSLRLHASSLELEDVDQIRALTKLCQADLRPGRIVTAEQLASFFLRGLVRVRMLIIRTCHASRSSSLTEDAGLAGLAGLTRLRVLHFYSCLTNIGRAHIGSLGGLTMLEVCTCMWP